jgi:hypothetical protein
MGGSVHLADRFGCSEERSIEERTAERSPGSAEKIAAVCKDGAPRWWVSLIVAGLTLDL